MITEDHDSQADLISYQACNMFNKRAAEIEGSFKMYSHDRFSSLMIHGITLKLLEDGKTPEQIKEILASKSIRWMLDEHSEDVIAFGKEIARIYQLGETKK